MQKFDDSSSVTFQEFADTLSFETLMRFDVVCEPDSFEARMISASVAGRKPLAENDGYFMRLLVRRIVGNAIDSRGFH